MLRIAQRHVRNIVHRAALRAFAQPHMARFFAQAGALAVGAHLGAAVAGQLFAHGGAIGFAVAALQVAHNAFKRVGFGHFPFAVSIQPIAKLHCLVARPKQHDLLHGVGQRFPRCFGIKAEMRRQALHHAKVVGVASVPAFNCATGQAQRRKRHHPLRVKHLFVAQAVAAGAGPLRRVERKQTRLQLGQRVAAQRAGKAGAKHPLLPTVHVHRHGLAVGQAQRGFQAFGQALLGIGAHFQAVHHHIQVVFFVLVERRHLLGLHHLPVEPKAHIALALVGG